jgi:AcrR family transcriptional regulator
MPGKADTRAAIRDAALTEVAAFGFRRASLDGVARRAGVSRATIYLHWDGKEALFRDLVKALHDDHLAAMGVIAERADLSMLDRLTGLLRARFDRFVELTSRSEHAAELYDAHDRLCGDIAREAHERAVTILAGVVERAIATGEADLSRAGLSARQVADALHDCAHAAKGTLPAEVTLEEFRRRLDIIVRMALHGIGRP